MVQNLFFAPAEVPSASRTGEDARPRDPQTSAVPAPAQSGQSPSVAAAQPAVSGTVVPAPDDAVSVQNVVLETDLLQATFSTKGAVLRSLKLKEHRDKDGFVDMVKTGTADDGAFTLAFGGADAKPLDTVFRVRKKDANTLEFFREFQISGYENSTFRLTKSFSVRPGEYLILMDVTLENIDNPNQFLPLNFNNIAYTVGYGPQTGPDFQKLDGQHDYRKFYYYAEGKRKDQDVKAGNEKELEGKTNWVGIVGKYFALLAAPVYSDFQVTLSSRPMQGISHSSMIFISKPVIKSSKNTDSYRFYAGPKIPRDLARYNDKAKNGFGIQNMQFDEALDSNIFLGWLENILKFLLRVFYGIIPNWGVAIILVTVAVKVVTFPLTQKSYKSTSRMQSLAPKMEELKKKYKDNPAKMNQETADLYKREGINPMSGCLPMLLQIPIFFAMYGLFSNHFDLRGAAFLPPWITDLSAPESIWNFAPFTLPIVGWSDLRLLPILFVATQLLSGTMMQTPGTGSNAQMKMMTYGIPVVFFFVLYDVPSGLLVYWIVMNALTIVQQMVINKMRKAQA
jgi:YidC/Oxa1 family membrane protein insertase